MRLLTAFVLIPLLTVVKSENLSEEENEERQKICGKGLKLSSYGRKVNNGQRVKISDAPWNVALELENGGPATCSGTLVSRRHVITARHCFADFDDNRNRGYMWMTNGSSIPGCDRENGSDAIVQEGNFDEMFRVFLGTDCGRRENCQKEIFETVGIRKIVLPKACDDSLTVYDDFAIVELSEDVNITKKVRPVCVAHSEDEIFDDEPPNMKLFGYGLDEVDGGMETAGSLKYESVALKRSDEKNKFLSKSISGDQMACLGDSGGGVVRMVDGRVTLVAVLYFGTKCYRSATDEEDVVASVPFYSDDVCKYTGICAREKKVWKKKKKERGKSESMRNVVGNSLINLFLYSLVFL